MLTVKEDLEQRIAALPPAPPEQMFQATMEIVAQVKAAVLEDLKTQLSCMTVDRKIEILAQLIVKHEVDAAMMDLGFKQLIAQLGGGRSA